MKEIKSSAVIQIERLKIKKEEAEILDLPNNVLMFNTSNLPSYINVAFYNLKIKPYIPPPNRCFNWQLFEHVADKCQSIKTCTSGQPSHDQILKKV